MSNLFGQLLNQWRLTKHASIDAARTRLEQRNKVDWSNNQAYKLEETEIKLPNGHEITEIRLWKLVDAEVVRMTSSVEAQTQEGVTALGDFHSDPKHPSYIDPSILKEEKQNEQNDDW